MLGVTPLTLRNWDKNGKLKAYRHPMNNYRVYKLEDIENVVSGIETTPAIKKVDGREFRKIAIQHLKDEQ